MDWLVLASLAVAVLAQAATFCYKLGRLARGVESLRDWCGDLQRKIERLEQWEHNGRVD